jgi:hypothetical protein
MTTPARRFTVLGLAMALLLGSLASLAAPDLTTTVRGRVFDSDLTTPLRGMTVQAFPEGSAEADARVVTDDSGRFVLNGLGDGAYLLLLSDETGTPVAAAEIATRAGLEQVVALALPDDVDPKGAEGSSKDVPGEDKGKDAAKDKAKGSEGGRFQKWLSTPLGATIGIVVSAVALSTFADSITDDNPRVDEIVISDPS